MPNRWHWGATERLVTSIPSSSWHVRSARCRRRLSASLRRALAGSALRHHLAAGLHGPLGLSDSAHWATGAAQPSRLAARHDFWNLVLSTLAMVRYLERVEGAAGSGVLPAYLPAVREICDDTALTL